MNDELMFYESKKQSLVHCFLRKDSRDSAKKAYNSRRSYDALLSLYYKTPSHVYVSGFIKRLHRHISVDDVEGFKQFLIDNGIETFEYERDGVLMQEKV